MKAILSTVFAVFLWISSSYANTDTQELKAYVTNLIDEGYEMFNDKSLSDSERSKKSEALIKSHLHLDWMAQQSLGRHRRELSSDQIAKFSKIYSEFVVRAYTELSSHYDGEKAVLKNIKQIDDDMFMVNLEIPKPDSKSPIKIEYLVHKLEKGEKDSYLIGDIITEGVSILNSQQAEFNSVLSSGGIDALMNKLKARAEKNTDTKPTLN